LIVTLRVAPLSRIVFRAVRVTAIMDIVTIFLAALLAIVDGFQAVVPAGFIARVRAILARDTLRGLHVAALRGSRHVVRKALLVAWGVRHDVAVGWRRAWRVLRLLWRRSPEVTRSAGAPGGDDGPPTWVLAALVARIALANCIVTCREPTKSDRRGQQ